MNTFDNIILQPTPLAQWYTLVCEAEVKCQYNIEEEVESYLVYLLMRFCRQVEWAHSILGLDFLKALQLPGTQSANRLKEIGDKSLLFCGLFPEIATKRHVNLHYFIDLGQGAYWQVGNIEAAQTSALFYSLCNEFERLKNILNMTRSLNKKD